MMDKKYPKGIEKLCEGMRLEKVDDGFMTCPVTFYMGPDHCFLNYKTSKQDITRKEECPLYMFLKHQEGYT